MIVEKIHFKMGTLHSVINLLKRNCWFASVDLKDAYYSVPISLAYQQYLSFCWMERRIISHVYLMACHLRLGYLLN